MSEFPTPELKEHHWRWYSFWRGMPPGFFGENHLQHGCWDFFQVLRYWCLGICKVSWSILNAITWDLKIIMFFWVWKSRPAVTFPLLLGRGITSKSTSNPYILNHSHINQFKKRQSTLRSWKTGHSAPTVCFIVWEAWRFMNVATGHWWLRIHQPESSKVNSLC